MLHYAFSIGPNELFLTKSIVHMLHYAFSIGTNELFLTNELSCIHRLHSSGICYIIFHVSVFIFIFNIITCILHGLLCNGLYNNSDIFCEVYNDELYRQSQPITNSLASSPFLFVQFSDNTKSPSHPLVWHFSPTQQKVYRRP